MNYSKSPSEPHWVPKLTMNSGPDRQVLTSTERNSYENYQTKILFAPL